MKKLFNVALSLLAAAGMTFVGCSSDSSSSSRPYVPEVTLTVNDENPSVGGQVIFKAVADTKNVRFEWLDASYKDISSDARTVNATSKLTVNCEKAGTFEYTCNVYNKDNEDSCTEKTCTIKVSAASATSVLESISSSGDTIKVGSTVNLKVTGQYKEGASTSTKDVTDLASFKSSDTSIATVSENGVVTGVKAGDATITVKYEDKTTEVKITVMSADLTLTSLKLVPDSATIKAGKTTNLKAKAVWSDSSETEVTPVYSSNDTSIATVSENGAVTGVKAGNATITAKYKYNNVEKTAAATITVEANTVVLQSIKVTPDKTEIKADEVATLTVKAVYSDSTEAAVTATSITPTDCVSVSGNKITGKTVSSDTPTTLTVSYTEGGVTKTQDITITVKADSTPSTGNGSISIDFN